MSTETQAPEAVQTQTHETNGQAHAAKSKAKKAAKKAAKKPAAEPKAKSPLTKPQVRILEALSKSNGMMTAAELAKRAEVAPSWVVGFTFRACKANTTPSLVEQKLAKATEDAEIGRCYEITPAGRKMLAKLAK
jgi:DNA-binding MarR family transcriptional regulator